MEILIKEDAEAVTRLASRIIAYYIKKKPDLVLGLATGRTMEPVYANLAEYHHSRGLDFSQVRTFNLDEYIGLDPEHPQSYYYFMNKHLFSKVNLRKENTRVLNGITDDVLGECAAFEREIRDAGGIDLQLLGIGRTGHIGFNEPTSSLYSRTRNKTLSQETVAQNGPLFGDPAKMPINALTMGVGTILDSRECILLGTGAEKSEIVAEAIEGPLTSMVTASMMQIHPYCTVILDEAAAACLKKSDYYRWVEANKPEWERIDWD